MRLKEQTIDILGKRMTANSFLKDNVLALLVCIVYVVEQRMV